MKKLLLLLCCSTLLFAMKLQWQENIPRGNEKPVVVMVEKDGCPWCKKMKFQTFADQKIQSSLQGFDKVLININRWNKMGFEKVQSVPTIFFLDKEKRVIKKVVGYWEAGDFAFDIRQVKKMLKQ